MTTEKATELIHLTYDGNFQLETDAKVLLCRVIGDRPNRTDSVNDQATIRVELQLDVTTMHPQGGGQPTDIGTIAANVEGSGGSPYSSKIEKVTIDRTTGIITHLGTICLSNNNTMDSDFFPENTSVKVSVDPTNRLLLSECHTAGHVVDAAMVKCGKLLPPTKGYHFLDGPYVEYKGSIDAKEREEFLGRLKVAFQELIDEDMSTEIRTIPLKQADFLCNRLAKNFNVEDFTCSTSPNPLVRVVSVAGGHGPCGGTHVRSTGVLKERGWHVKGLKCKKGVVRVRYGRKVN